MTTQPIPRPKARKLPRCVLCGSKKNVRLWTVDAIRKVAVTYLCAEHGAPLQEIMDAAGGIPLKEQIPVPERIPPEPETKKPKLVPLLDWTPPAEDAPA